MKIERQSIEGKGFNIPSIVLTPSNAIGAAVIAHGYGGCKEEQLGLAFRVAELGIITYVIDLRGHGKHELPLDENVILDVETAVKYAQRFGNVVAIGHSLGGRLALLSSAEYAIGVSPALNKTFSTQTKESIKTIRSYRVKEARPNVLFELLNNLPEWQSDENDNAEVVFGSRDIPEIISACNKLKDQGLSVAEIDTALHSDIFTLEATFARIISKLEKWF